MAKAAIVVFPGSNCERDVRTVLEKIYKFQTELVWHNKSKLGNFDAIVIPGGFSYGDRLRAGAIAAHSPVVREIKRLAVEGIPVLGVCNGFQILVEAGLLPGALTVNSSLRFVCKWTAVKVVNNKTPFTGGFGKGDIFYIPIAHGEGRYIADPKMLKAINRRNQIVLVYSEDNPNGSVGAIAGLCNEQGNVVGVMPHPERGTESILTPLGLPNAYGFFESLRIYCSRNH